MQTATLHITVNPPSLSGTVDGKPIPPQSFSDLESLDDALDQLIGVSDDSQDQDEDQDDGSGAADDGSVAAGGQAPSAADAAQPPTGPTAPSATRRPGAVPTHMQMWNEEAAARKQRNAGALTNLGG